MRHHFEGGDPWQNLMTAVVIVAWDDIVHSKNPLIQAEAAHWLRHHARPWCVWLDAERALSRMLCELDRLDAARTIKTPEVA